MLRPGVDTATHEFGGRRCLALVNTVLWRRSSSPQDLATTYADLLSTLATAGVLDERQRRRLAGRAAAEPGAAVEALRDARALREALFGVLSAVAAGSPPAAAGLRALNRALGEAANHTELVLRRGEPAAVWRPDDDPRVVAWMAAESAAGVLLGTDRSRLKQCPGPECGWLFLDESRNHTRRWCDTRLCGNRERVRSHYARRRVARN